jgi:tRNA G18 (ribose-2'-O)-methylase SpoU
MHKIVLVAHNIRSTHNIGSLFRTADGLGVQSIHLTGYSPYPISSADERLPHVATKIHHQIEKTALGSEKSMKWQKHDDVKVLIQALKAEGFSIVALEQTTTSVDITKFKPTDKLALVVGNEITGIEPWLLKLADSIIEIPMLGAKESFNVAQAAAMAMFYLRFYPGYATI